MEKLEEIRKKDENKFNEVLLGFSNYKELINSIGISKYFKENVSFVEFFINFIVIGLIFAFVRNI